MIIETFRGSIGTLAGSVTLAVRSVTLTARSVTLDSGRPRFAGEPEHCLYLKE